MRYFGDSGRIQVIAAQRQEAITKLNWMGNHHWEMREKYRATITIVHESKQLRRVPIMV